MIAICKVAVQNELMRMLAHKDNACFYFNFSK
jgi:hypothetical protein